MRIFSFKPPVLTLEDKAMDSQEALQEFGHSLKVFKIPRDGLIDKEALRREIEESSPDLIFTVDHQGIIPEIIHPLRIPYVSWFGNDPFIWIERDRPYRWVSSYCLVFVCERLFVDELKRFGFENVYYLPLCTNPKVFRKMRLSEEDQRRYGCNISFAGDAMAKAYWSFYNELSDRRLRDIVDEVISIQTRNSLLPIEDILDEVRKSEGLVLDFVTLFKETFILRLQYAAAAHQRREILKEISHLGLLVSGDENWKGFLAEEMDIKGIRFFDGKGIEYKRLPKLYNASKINLNITKPGVRTALPMRVFDISASGAFLLTDYRRDLGELFDLEGEIVFYRDREDLRRKAEYYLAHEDEREEIANRAKERVLSHHTYKHRIEEILQITNEVFGL
jgi:spore maturation protein CgeB